MLAADVVSYKQTNIATHQSSRLAAAVNLFLLKLQGAFVAIVYCTLHALLHRTRFCPNYWTPVPLEKGLLKIKQDRRTAGMYDVTASAWSARINIRDKWVQWHRTRFTCAGNPLNEVHRQGRH